jgi:hypothetical protein
MELQRGDHIMVSRGVYFHHGIYIGEGNVVHWQGDLRTLLHGEEEPEIGLDDLDAFKEDGEVAVVEYSEEICVLEPVEVIHRALSRLGETGYNIVGNNCEHFAIWAKTGRHESTQVNEAVEWLGEWIGRLLPGPGPAADVHVVDLPDRHAKG